MTCSRDGVADCGMAGRVQTAARSGRTWVGCLPVAPLTEPGAQAASASSRQTKGGASRSQDARTAGLQRAEGETCTSCTLPCTVLGKIPSRPHILCTLLMYSPASTACRYGPGVPSTCPCPRPGQATASRKSNSDSPDSQPGLTAFPSKVLPCSDHQLAVWSRFVSSAW